MGSGRSRSPLPAPGLRIIAAASWLVPTARRDAWRREWEAEAEYAWRILVRRGTPSALRRARLRLRVLTCWIDALWERRERLTMTGLFNDLRFALRSLLRYPAFTAIAVVTLALGIGANTAVFTLVDGVLIKPLPFPHPERLLSIQHLGRDGADQLPVSQGLYLLYRKQASTLADIGLYRRGVANLAGEGEPERVPIQVVTPDFFDALGVKPRLGRAFTTAEARPGAAHVAIISDGLWHTDFGGDPGILGRTVDLDGVTTQVVGVMPPGFGFPDQQARLWLPLVIDPNQAPLASFDASGVARMAPDATQKSVLAQLQELVHRLPQLYPDQAETTAFLAHVKLAARVEPLKESLVGNVSRTLWVLMGTVGLVLLIACANVANLLLVRAEGRQRELALRVAVGAGRADVLRAFMSESAVLSVLGGTLGVAIAAVAVRVSTRFIPTAIPRMAGVGIDLPVLGFTALVALGCAVLFGLFPLVRYGVEDLAHQLREGSARGASAGRRTHRTRNTLVMVQVALALVLLVGSGLMLRSFIALRSVSPGFQADGVLTARLSVPAGDVPGWRETEAFYRELHDRIAAQRGVQAVGFSSATPLGGGGMNFSTIEVEDHPRGPNELPIFATQILAGPGYFAALGIPVESGRTFRSDDGADGTRAAVVSESFARHWWPNGSPLGRRVGQDGDWYRIVGVVGDVHFVGLQRTPPEVVYFPTTFGPTESPSAARTLDVLVKTAGDPLAFVPVLRRELHDLNARIPLSNPRTMPEVLTEATARTSFTMALLGVASGIALLLGLVGIYGVISYIVSQRTREIGVRMALGATASSVRHMVVFQGLALAAGGVAVGLVATLLLSRLMTSLLFGVSPVDPLTYAAISVALLCVAWVASWLPARRAAGVDPSLALRSE